MNVTDIRAEFHQLKGQRSTIEGTWDLIEKFVSPIRGGRFFDPQSSEHSISQRRPEIYDNTAISASVNLAATLQGYLTSDVVAWFQLRFRDEALKQNVEAQQWLETAANITYYHLQDSNFSAEIGEAYLDLVSFGNTCFTIEYENGELVFQCVPVREILYVPDHKGKSLRFYRDLQWTASKIISKFGDKAPALVTECKDLDRKFRVIFCVYPQEEGKAAKGVAPADKRPWLYKYVMAEGNPEEALIGEGGLYSNPAMISRWAKSSGSQWGHGLGNIALPLVQTLNEVVKMTLIASEKAIDPPTLVTERGLLSDLSLGAGGITTVRRLEDIGTHESKARFDVSTLIIQDMRAAIERIFLSEHTNVQMADRMTAAEYQGRHQRMARMLGGTLGRLSRELFDPIIEKAFDHLVREKKIPPYPAEVAKLNPEIDIVYTGPLSSAQKVDALNASMSFIGFAAQMEQVLEGMLDHVDPARYSKYALEAVGLPYSIQRTDAEVIALQQQRAEAKQAAQDAAQQQMQGDAMQSVAKGQQEFAAAQGVPAQ
jgi:hypothetical protein